MALSRCDIEIDKGFEWEALLLFPGYRFMSANLKGQMRPDALSPTVLAAFKFDFPLYRTEEDQTEIRVYLPKASTLLIPSTTTALWVYDMRANLDDGSSYLLLAGQVRVWQTITEG